MTKTRVTKTRTAAAKTRTKAAARGPKKGLKRRVARSGGLALVKRLLKPLPVVGTAVALGSAGYEMRKKGVRGGALSVGLDLIPVVGTAKAVVEIFAGDLVPDKKRASS